MIEELSDVQLSDLEYWKQRCILAEKCWGESPCDPDITIPQIIAGQEYDSFIERHGDKRLNKNNE